MSKALDAATLAVRLCIAHGYIDHAATRGPIVYATDALKLMRLSASLRGLSAYVPPHGGINMAQERRLARLTDEVGATLKPYGLKWRFHTARDNGSVSILFPDGSSNAPGGSGEGWRV